MSTEKVYDSVDLRSLINGIRKDVEVTQALREGNIAEDCGMCPGEIGGESYQDTHIEDDTDNSAKRNAQVVQNEKDLKAAVGQNSQQEFADEHKTSLLKDDVSPAISEEPKEEMAYKEPTGDVAAAVDETMGMETDRKVITDLATGANAEFEKEQRRAKNPKNAFRAISYSKSLHPTKKMESKVNEMASECDHYNYLGTGRKNARNGVSVTWKFVGENRELTESFLTVGHFLIKHSNEGRQIEWYQAEGADRVAMVEGAVEEAPVTKEFGTSEVSSFRNIFEGSRNLQESTKPDVVRPLVEKRRISISEGMKVLKDLKVGNLVTLEHGDDVDMVKVISKDDTGIVVKCDGKRYKIPAKSLHDHGNYIVARVRESLYSENVLLKKFGLNEEQGMAPGGGSSTVAMDAGSIPPTKTDVPAVAPAQNPENFDKSEKQPEANEQGEKEYFGKQGDDNYYYVLYREDDSDGNPGGIPSEDKPDVSPEVKPEMTPADMAPVGEEHLAHESKVQEISGTGTYDYPADKSFGDKFRANYLAKAKELRAQKKPGDKTENDLEARKEIEELEKSWKADSSMVPNESIAKLVESFSDMPEEELLAWYREEMKKHDNDRLINMLKTEIEARGLHIPVKERKIKENYTSLQIIDASGKVVADAEGQGLDTNDIKGFLLKSMDDLELTEIAPDIVKEYLLAAEDEEGDDEMTDTPEEEKRIKTQGAPPLKDEKVEPGQNVASESTTKEKGMKALMEKYGLTDLSVGELMEKFNLIEPLTVDMLLEKF